MQVHARVSAKSPDPGKERMNKVIRTILLVIMLASLAGCEGGCGDVVDNAIVFYNESDISVNAEVSFGSGGGSDANDNTVIIPPHDKFKFGIGSNASYAASAKPMSDWLRNAESRRAQLVEKLNSAKIKLAANEQVSNDNSIAQNPISMVVESLKISKGREEIQSLEAELRQLQADIAAFKAQITSRKSCRGIVSNEDREGKGYSIVRVTNGEDARSIKISCVDPKK
jgi:hypothetical protein